MRTLLLLVTLAVPSLAVAQDVRVSHPGGDLDVWLHQQFAYYSPQAVQQTASVQQPAIVTQTYSTYPAASYPTHPVSWHINGSRESKAELISHLITHPEHWDVRQRYTVNDLHQMSRAQLQTLHDDSHERRIAKVRIVAPAPMVGVYSAATGMTYSSSCPGGNCPSSRQSKRSRRSERESGDFVGGRRVMFGLINVNK